MATTVVWFRNCLRLHDNLALLEASKVSNNVVCVFIFTPSVYDPKYMGINRFHFLLQSLQDLKKQLKEKYNGDLVLINTKSTYKEVFATLVKHSPIDNVFYEYDSAPYAKIRDLSIKEHLRKEHPQVKFTSFQGHTLTDLAKITGKNGFKNPINMNMVEKIMLEEFGKGKGGAGINVPSTLNPPTTIQFNSCFTEKIETACKNIMVMKKVPKLHELSEVFGESFKNIDADAVISNTYFQGGETEALQRLQMKVLDQVDYVCKFKKPETSSITSSKSMFREPSTTGLSPYLAHGCLSIRKFWNAVDLTFDKKKNPKIDNLAMSLYGQVLFREMFYILNESIGENFAKNIGTGNPALTKFVGWNDYDPKLIQAWEDGKTGYPYIDALMRQMKTTGWMHHLGRHAVSCFLTRGQMYQNWTHGRDVFDRLLVDSDYALNTGNWLWLSGIAPYSMPYFRVYNPCPQEDKKSALNFDKGGNDFIRHWVPELKKFPAKYLTNPWECPSIAQTACGVIIGKDYPKPIVPLKNNNMDKFKTSMAQNKAFKESQASPPAKKLKLK